MALWVFVLAMMQAFFPAPGPGLPRGAGAGSANAAPPVQANTSGGSGGATSISQAFTTHVTTGNLLILYVFNSTDLTTTVNSVVWTGGAANCGSFVPTPLTPINGSTRRMWVYYAQVTASDCTGVTFAFSASINAVVIFAEYAGLATSGVLDVEKAGTGTSTAITSGTVATTNANDLLVGGIFVTSSGGGTLTASGGYTIRVNNASTTHRGLEDLDVSATGSYAATATYSSSQTFIAHMLALKRYAGAMAGSSQYYLATAGDGGSDANNGLSPLTPWLTPNHPVNCGDTITAKASSVYQAANFASSQWGTVTCPTADRVAWLKCETFDACRISASNVFAMNLNKSYWGIQGWETTGTGNNGVCYGVQPTGSPSIHHIILANNVANGCANGFAFSSLNSTTSFDYIAAIGNIAWNAAQSTALCNSGITVYEPIKTDSVSGTHIYVSGNFTFDNSSPTNCLSGSSTYDGNGIALDDIGNVQSGGAAYDQQIVVENNLSVWNGGWGLANTGNGTHSAPVTYRYNTSAKNLQASNTSIATCGDFALLDSYLTVVTNNLIVTRGATACSGPTTLYAVAVNSANATTTVATNWLYSATGSNTTAISSPGFSFGSNTTGTDPSFANPVDPGSPNCSGKLTTVDCAATLISNYTPANTTAKTYGYQSPKAPDTVSDPLFPAWLCKANIPSGLITLHCP